MPDGQGAGSGAAGGGDASGSGGGNSGAGAGGDGAGSNTDWRSDLPEAFRDLPFVGKANTIEEAVQGIRNASSYMGNSIRIPGPDSSAEDRAKFAQKAIEKFPGLIPSPDPDNPEAVNAILARLGMPKEASDYGVPESTPYSAEAIGEMKAWAHEAGMTKKQWESFFGKMAGKATDADAMLAATTKAQHDALVGEWGMAYDEKCGQIMHLLSKLEAPEALKDAIKGRTLDPDSMKLFDKLAVAINEEGAPMAGFGKGDTTTRLTPAEAQARVHEVMGDPDYFDANSPRQKMLMKKVRDYLGDVPA